MGYRLVDDQAPEAPKAPKGKFLIVEDGPKKNYYETSPLTDTLTDTVKNATAGMTSGAAKIGASLLTPVDMVRSLAAGERPMAASAERRKGVQDALTTLGAEPEATAFKAGELGSEVAGTGGVGGALAKIPLLAKYAPRLAAAIESGGFKLGSTAPATTLAGKAGEWGLRTTGGAVTGGVSAAMVDPASAPEGMAIGAAAPGAVKLAGEAGAALAPKVGDEVKALYEKAKKLGIDIPVDRILNSKPLNAAAASLNYVPLSGRAGTEDRMVSQLQRAVSRTFGQDSPNVTAALRKADQSLGDKFELTLKQNSVKADNDLLQSLAENVQRAGAELGEAEGARIAKLADEILGKVGPNGEITGQAAYNLKKMLDRVGSSNSESAYHARQLRGSLMDALDRSLGPDEAAAFKKLRQQYGNMMEIEKLAANGAEGGISVARLANLKNVNNQDLQDLADIAAQFVKGRESAHGAAQRAFLGGGAMVGSATAPAALPYVAAAMAGGRAANTALNSNLVKRAVLSDPQAAKRMQELGELAPLRALLYAPTGGR